MASSPSGQNFLRLLFGGANQGLDRAFQQQDQSTDLAMQLQQMMTRQKEFRERTNLIESGQEGTQARFDKSFEADQERFRYRQEQDSANRARQGNIDIFNQMQAWRDRVNQAATRKSMIDLRKAQAESLRRDKKSSSDAQKRMALQNRYKNITDSPRSYGQPIEERIWEKMMPSVQGEYERYIENKKVFYRRLTSRARRSLSAIDRELTIIGEVPPTNLFGLDMSAALDVPEGVTEGPGTLTPAPPSRNAVQDARAFLEEPLD